MADLDIVDPRDQLGLEFLANRILDQQTRRRCATLAIDRVDHKDRRIQGPIQISVIKHNDRVLATKFKVVALVCVCALFRDQAACAALPNKRDGLDLGMFTQRLTRAFAKAVNGVQHPRWQACLFGYLDQQTRSQWRRFCGFMNNGAPCG